MHDLCCFEGTQNDCVGGYLFSSFADTNYVGGVEQASSVNDLELCRAACLADDDCLAVDWTGTVCWLHLDSTK